MAPETATLPVRIKDLTETVRTMGISESNNANMLYVLCRIVGDLIDASPSPAPLTKREEIASRLMAGILAANPEARTDMYASVDAIKQADDLINELSKEPTP